MTLINSPKLQRTGDFEDYGPVYGPQVSQGCLPPVLQTLEGGPSDATVRELASVIASLVEELKVLRKNQKQREEDAYLRGVREAEEKQAERDRQKRREPWNPPDAPWKYRKPYVFWCGGQ